MGGVWGYGWLGNRVFILLLFSAIIKLYRILYEGRKKKVNAYTPTCTRQ